MRFDQWYAASKPIAATVAAVSVASAALLVVTRPDPAARQSEPTTLLVLGAAALALLALALVVLRPAVSARSQAQALAVAMIGSGVVFGGAVGAPVARVLGIVAVAVPLILGTAAAVLHGETTPG